MTDATLMQLYNLPGLAIEVQADSAFRTKSERGLPPWWEVDVDPRGLLK